MGCAEDTKVKTLLLASSCLLALCASAHAAPKMLTAQCTENADHVRTCLAPGEAPISPEHAYPPDQAIAQAPVGPLPPPPPLGPPPMAGPPVCVVAGAPWEWLNLRAAPDGPVLMPLPPGTQLTVFNAYGRWGYVQTGWGYQGWVFLPYVPC
jgi:hypothetical protein